ncbi:hypothetical protein HOF65_00630 [bacterium]|nr:hypothetical protein [bacterium]MBT3852550.1 hypothetical protein [bacterium]MBT4632716.1 hypothetical protein [bacterium]MBT6778568.1 hypothetical protein [bacterium]
MIQATSHFLSCIFDVMSISTLPAIIAQVELLIDFGIYTALSVVKIIHSSVCILVFLRS